jgi:hypothetical protein
MSNTSRASIRNWPLWWFSKLECAVERGDFAAAARAQRELARLGVRVDFGWPRDRSRPGARANARRRG